MKFDIILPSIGRDSLCRAIDSVICQDYGDWHLYVYEQSSMTDIDDYLKDRVTYCYDCERHNDYGAFARNSLISQGSSTWIAYLDDDDIWLPNHLTTIAECASINTEANMIRTWGRSFSWRHKSPRSSKLVRKLGQINSSDVLTVGMAHTRELFLRTSGWQPVDNHDRLLWNEMLANEGRSVVHEEVTFEFCR